MNREERLVEEILTWKGIVDEETERADNAEAALAQKILDEAATSQELVYIIAKLGRIQRLYDEIEKRYENLLKGLPDV